MFFYKYYKLMLSQPAGSEFHTLVTTCWSHVRYTWSRRSRRLECTPGNHSRQRRNKHRRRTLRKHPPSSLQMMATQCHKHNSSGCWCHKHHNSRWWRHKHHSSGWWRHKHHSSGWCHKHCSRCRTLRSSRCTPSICIHHWIRARMEIWCRCWKNFQQRLNTRLTTS